MDGQVFKVTGLNPRLEMEIGRLMKESAMPVSWLEGPEIFARFDSQGSVAGVAGSRALGNDCILQFVAVRGDMRRQGVGSSLVGRVLDFYSGECERIFLLSRKDTEGFFERFGFGRISSDMIPDSIRNSKAVDGVEIARTIIMTHDLPRKWPIL